MRAGDLLHAWSMNPTWWLATAAVPLLLILVGAPVAYLRYRLSLRRFYGRRSSRPAPPFWWRCTS